MKARLAVFGLGYVGTVSAACFAERGHEVVGVDVNPDKIAMIQDGRTPVVEERIGEVVRRGVESGRLRATTDVADAVSSSDIAFVCVGTPSLATGSLSTEYLERVCDQIGESLPLFRGRYTIAIRSTMFPGTGERLVRRLEQASSLTSGEDFGFCVNPEFLREGTSVADFWDPPKTVIGELDPASGDPVAALYTDFPAPLFRVPIRVAEMTKCVDNAFHALKVAFANEVGTWAKSLGLDSHRVMQIFRADTKLNISPAYLQPGFAFGGSCLPKDLRALIHAARHADVQLPVIESILPSNKQQVQRVYEMVLASGSTRVGLFGLAFKTGTDDLRESPMVHLAEQLLGRGMELLIYDEQVAVSRLHGANRAYVDGRIPHLARLMVSSPDAVASHADVCVLATEDSRAVDAIARAHSVTIIDLVRPPGYETLKQKENYIGIAW